MADIKQISIAGTVYDVKDAGAVPKKADSANRYYSFIKSSTGASSYKITFPYSTSTATSAWFMNSFDINIGGPYSNGPCGVLHVSYYVSRSSDAWVVTTPKCLAEGTNITTTNTKLYYLNSNPGNLYVVIGGDHYRGIALTNLYSFDTASSLDYLTTTITQESVPSSGVTEIAIGILTDSSYSGSAARATLAENANYAASATTAAKSNQILDGTSSTYKSTTSKTLTITKSDGTTASYNVLTV